LFLATYRELFTVFSQNALFDLKRHYPEEWGSIMELRKSQWQRIAAAINSGMPEASCALSIPS
jgi:hypothetical protein